MGFDRMPLANRCWTDTKQLAFLKHLNVLSILSKLIQQTATAVLVPLNVWSSWDMAIFHTQRILILVEIHFQSYPYRGLKLS